jgi:predicted SnoaL-like aldol condensation-catalyzing enzyme
MFRSNRSSSPHHAQRSTALRRLVAALGLVAAVAACADDSSSDADNGGAAADTSAGSTSSAADPGTTSAPDTGVSTTSAANTASTSSTSTLAGAASDSPRAVVEDFVQRVMVDGDVAAVDELVSPDLQRLPSTEDGAAGLTASLAAAPPSAFEAHVIIAEGDRVAVLYTKDDPALPTGRFEGLDIYVVREGLITEHTELTSTANGAPAGSLPPTLTQPVVAASAEEVESNRQLAQAFFAELFGNGDPTAVDRYVSPNYLQHNPSVAPGAQGLKDLITATGPSPMEGLGVGGTIAEGNFVVNISELPIADDFLLVDVFRVESGVLAEHWDFTPLGTTLGAPPS